MTRNKERMTLEEILNGLDLLAYEAEKQGHSQKEKVLYAASSALRRLEALERAGQGMREYFHDSHDEDCPQAVWDWDAAVKGEALTPSTDVHSRLEQEGG